MKSFFRLLKTRVLVILVLTYLAIVCVLGFVKSEAGNKNQDAIQEITEQEHGTKRKLKQLKFKGLPVVVHAVRNLDKDDDDE